VEWGILVIFVILILVAYVIVQETRAQLFWRSLVDKGDVSAIRELLEGEIERWHTERVPRGTPALLWHGIQTSELLDVAPDGAHMSCNAEGEYALSGGRRVETSSPLAEGMKITQKLAEMLLYDVPNVKLDRVQIDVYTSFREAGGQADTRCILSTLVVRSLVEHIDWEETEPADFVSLNQGRFAANGDGALAAIEPLTWDESASTRS
jgi:hypothetical protein